MTLSEFMNLEQASKYLGFKSQKSLNNYIREGLPVVIIGKSKRISKTAIDAFMKEHEVIVGKESD
ncbi:hypothetical protein LRLP16767_LR202_00053 [Limosilactobacillus reuteri]|uniref:Uncharacterized protein n=2 Tax=Lactobacillaceae TaxID=33958 RepID=A0A0U5JT55_LIMRT|nr:DNA-binding protein [Limosilactobacillus reuteri]MRN07784.1 DNA-binding protein [Lactobacillus sp. 0.1XD8-4]CUR40003.1 hypothetical protein LRLP16767_LR202_00053 [Limosilactobacillus reuteri]